MGGEDVRAGGRDAAGVSGNLAGVKNVSQVPGGDANGLSRLLAGRAGTMGDGAYVTSCTDSFDFPIHNAFQPYLAGAAGAYLLKVNRDGSLAWSTYLGGFGYDCANSVAVDAEGFPWTRPE